MYSQTIEAFYSLFSKIKSSWLWAKFGWNDHDYDYVKILEALLFKLKINQKAMEFHGRHESSEDDAKQMMEAIVLLNNFITDKHHEESEKVFVEKYGEMVFAPFPIQDGLFGCNLSREKIQSAEEEEAYALEYHSEINSSYEKGKADLTKSFGIILDNCERWWI